jgi:hypothetical protein
MQKRTIEPEKRAQLRDARGRGRSYAFSISKSDRVYHVNLLDRCTGGAQTRSMRVELPSRLLRPELYFLMALLGLLQVVCVGALADPVPEENKVLVIFSDQALRDSAWAALLSALEKGAQDEAAAAPGLAENVVFVRGDRMVAGIDASEAISVYLHGDCSLVPVARTNPMGALGWVRRVRGRIEPFIHVDCTKIAEELGPVALGMNRQRLDQVMSEAVARVIVHEWVHVATQNPGHAREGVAKSSFDVLDLLAEDEAVRRNPRVLQRWKWN